MKRKEIQKLIETHQGRLQRAANILNENYYDFEQQEDQSHYQYWISEFKKEKQIITWLQGLEPDD